MISEETSLDELIAQSIRNAISADSIRAKVEAAADKAIGEAISNAFGYNSPFRKGLEETVKNVIQVPEDKEVAVFANATRELIQRRLTTLASDTAKAHLSEVLEKVLPSNPVVTLKDLEEEFQSKLKQDDSYESDGYEADYRWDVEKSTTSSLSGYWDLIVSANPNARDFADETIRLRFQPSKDDPELFVCWNVTGIDKPNKQIFTGPLYGFDLLVWRLATGVAKLSRKQA